MSQLYALIMADDQDKGPKLVAFCQGLKELGYVIFASDKTAAFLMRNNVPAEYLSSLTGHKEYLTKMRFTDPLVHMGLVSTSEDSDVLRLRRTHPWDVVFISSPDVSRDLSLPNATRESVGMAIDGSGLITLFEAAVRGQRIVLYSTHQCARVLELLKTNEKFPQAVRDQLVAKAAGHVVAQMSAVAAFWANHVANHPDSADR